MQSTNNNPSREAVKEFVQSHFEETNELQDAELPDWRPNPSILDRIKDPQYKSWAADLNEIWKDLARRMTPDVRDNPKRHSLIYVENTFIVPGGRFKGELAEFLVWVVLIEYARCQGRKIYIPGRWG